MLTVYQNWAERRYRHLFGRLTYNGVGVYGFTATGSGAPLDGYGRNVYVDTFDSRYGRGWHRENGFLTHHRGKTLGDFCYGFFPHFGHPPGKGTKYRATAEGPGVTPDVMWAATISAPTTADIQDQSKPSSEPGATRSAAPDARRRKMVGSRCENHSLWGRSPHGEPPMALTARNGTTARS